MNKDKTGEKEESKGEVEPKSLLNCPKQKQEGGCISKAVNWQH